VVLAVTSLAAASPVRPQWVTTPAWTFFAPANDVAFTISTERKTYSVREAFTLKYRIVNISGRALYAPRTWSVTCPAFPHVMAWFEDSAGRHSGSGYGGSCQPVTLTLAERIVREAVLLKPGEHLDGTIPLDPTGAGGLPPYAYRLEATLHGWNSSGFAALTDEEQRELPTLGAPLLRGEIPTSIRLTLKP
jgi:hypothetical protein